MTRAIQSRWARRRSHVAALQRARPSSARMSRWTRPSRTWTTMRGTSRTQSCGSAPDSSLATQLRICSHDLCEPRRAGCDRRLRDGWLADGVAKGGGAAHKKFEAHGLSSSVLFDEQRRARRRGSDELHVVGGRDRGSSCSRWRRRRAAVDGGCSVASVLTRRPRALAARREQIFRIVTNYLTLDAFRRPGIEFDLTWLGGS